MNKDGLRILEYSGEGYSRVVNGAKWTLAGLNYAERFDERNIVDLERHNLTDETFVLLKGEATLLLWQGGDALPTENGACGKGVPALAEGMVRQGEENVARASSPLRRISMQPLKYYNVGAGVWHNIIVSKDARVLVAENADTSKDNTDYLEIATGRIFKKRPTFEEVLPGTYLLKVPFGPVWTGVVLVMGRTSEVVLIDSSHLDPERYLIPALADLGLKPSDIDWLLNTHVHGDHIGGHHALVTKYGLKTATLRKNADALRDPVKVAVRVRTRFPKNSPAPQSYLKGVEPDLLLEEGDLLAGRFACISTPGHDDDCQTWIDTRTGTAFTGDSLQANGTPTQGIGFYRDLPAYRETLKKLRALANVARASSPLQTEWCGRAGTPCPREIAHVARASSPLLKINNIVLGHDYDGIGCVVKGEVAVQAAIGYCEERLFVYGKELAALIWSGSGRARTPCPREDDACGKGVPALADGMVRQGEDALPTENGACGKGVPALAQLSDESALVPLALRLIGKVGCGMPDSLFLALHTVSEHLKEM